jgi:hypothetical protein
MGALQGGARLNQKYEPDGDELKRRLDQITGLTTH